MDKENGITPSEDASNHGQTQPVPPLELLLTVSNTTGLHARPAARFTQAIVTKKAQVKVTNLSTGKGPVLINGLISVLLLGAKRGHKLKLTIEGPDAQSLATEIETLFKENFGE